jgi:hypothetical protein
VQHFRAERFLRRELIDQAAIAGCWLHNQGYRGTASVDFLVVHHEHDMPRVYICEINARVTGATYPAVLARHFLPAGSWIMRNLQPDEPLPGPALLDKLSRGDHLFRPGRPRGILPINFNTDDAGRVHKGQFLCLAETVAECHELLRSAEQKLEVPWRYVRD